MTFKTASLTAAVFAAVFAWAASSPAATVFVSVDGGDDNPGTRERPFRTIQKAADSAEPGDTVQVGPGIFGEAVSLNVSGAPGAPIVIQGTRGPDGEWLTVLDRSVPAEGWEPAPEVGPGVFKAALGFRPITMTLDGQLLARVNDRHMQDGQGFAYLSMPPDAPLLGNERVPELIRSERHVAEDHLFWDGIEVLCGYMDGVTYIRFRHGDDPNKKDLRVTSGAEDPRVWPRPGEGGGFTIHDQSHIVLRDFRVRSAQVSVHLHGAKATDNVVERNRLVHGRMRVLVTGGASSSVVRDNEMTLAYYGHDRPGAWGTADTDMESSLAGYVYRVFKHVVGGSSSDDRAVLVRHGCADIEVSNNNIYSGLIGISVGNAPRIRVFNNKIRHMSSIGLHNVPDGGKGPVDGEFYDNLIYDCNIALRLHRFNTAAPGGWRAYFYRNVFRQPENRGNHIYVHWHGPDGPGALDGIGHPEIFIYHNTFSGGNSGLVPGRVRPGGGLRKMRVVNNVFSCPIPTRGVTFFAGERDVIDVFDYNWLGGELPGEAEWLGENNVVAPGERLWAADESRFRLPEGSAARNAGVDLSKPSAVQGRELPALPGMAPGYFQGDAPDMGAVQSGSGNQ